MSMMTDQAGQYAMNEKAKPCTGPGGKQPCPHGPQLWGPGMLVVRFGKGLTFRCPDCNREYLTWYCSEQARKAAPAPAQAAPAPAPKAPEAPVPDLANFTVASATLTIAADLAQYREYLASEEHGRAFGEWLRARQAPVKAPEAPAPAAPAPARPRKQATRRQAAPAAVPRGDSPFAGAAPNK